MQKVKKAVIPAAGLGTRFLPATKAQPKEMLPIVDTPVIEFSVREAIASGIDDILIVTGRGKRAIEDYFDKSLELEAYFRRKGNTDASTVNEEIGADIHFIRQREPLGLGHALLQAAKHIGNEPFAVILADELYISEPPCLRQLIDVFEEVAEPVIGLRAVPDEQVRRYGIAEGAPAAERLMKITRLVEKPEPETTSSRLAISGRYILVPEVFDSLRVTPPGKNQEIQLTDALQILLSRRAVYGYLVQAQAFYDVGDKLGFLKATVDFALQRNDLRESLRDFLLEKAVSLNGPEAKR